MVNKKHNKGRTSETTTLREAIDSMIDSYRLRRKFDATVLISSWEEMMGTPIARRTDRMWVKDRKLFVKLNSATLKNELTIAKHKVLEIIYEKFGKDVVLDVVFL